MLEHFKVAAAQMCSNDNPEKNFDECEKLIADAHEEKARLVALPENFAFLGSTVDDSLNFCQPLNSILFNKYKSLAKKYTIWISYGGFQEQIPGDTKHCYNSHVLVNPAGEIAAIYRKIHLFSVNLPGQIQLDESEHTRAGATVTCAQTELGVAGLAICYDLRFAELFITLRQLGAEFILLPAAFTFETGCAHWEILLRARAIETQCYVIAAAQYGRHNPNRKSYGHALIVDPWGNVIAQASDTSQIITATLSHKILSHVRSAIPIAAHRILELLPKF